MNVLWVSLDAVRTVPTPMEAMCAVVTLDTKSLPTTELVWVREYLTLNVSIMITFFKQFSVIESLARNFLTLTMNAIKNTRPASKETPEDQIA